MSFIYLTGAPGSGKSALFDALVDRGYTAYDLDSPSLGGPYNRASGVPSVIPPASQRTAQWFAEHEWRINRTELLRLKSESRNKPIFICGVAEKDVEIIDLFDTIFYLSLPDDQLKERLANRIGNDYGKNEFEVTNILTRKAKLDVRYQTTDVIVVDASKTIEETLRDIVSAISV